MTNSLWVQVAGCFDTDDGSLPGIEVANLSPAGVSAIYAMLRRRSTVYGDPPEFWIRTRQASIAVDSVPDAAGLVAAGDAEAFHHCLKGIEAGGATLPVLGFFVWRDAIELDYRMGMEWGPAEANGLFELLRDCCALDPTATVIPAEQEGPPNPEGFLQAWKPFNGMTG